MIINRGGGQGRVLPAANETFELSLVCGGVGFNAVLQVRNSTLTTGFLPDKVNCLATITRPPATPYESVGFSYNGVDGGQFLRVHDRHPLEIFFLFPLAKA